MTTHDLYRKAVDADNAWHDALVAEFGERGAIRERYRVQPIDGHTGHPDHIRKLHLAYRRASDAYFAAVAKDRAA